MFGLLIVPAVYFVLAFILAWITGLITREEISIGTAMLVLVCTFVLNLLFGALFPPDDAITQGLVTLMVTLATLSSMLWLLAKIPFKKAILIALAFAIVIMLVSAANSAILS